jgi:hypothetical protein
MLLMANEMRCVLTTILTLFLTMALSVTVLAQDDTRLTHPDPAAEDVMSMATESSIQEVTDVSDEFYGELVTLEGEIGEFVNSYSFALGEGAEIDNDLVLVINNATKPYAPEIITEARVQVTGRVHPSQVAINEGAMTDFGSLFTDEYWGDLEADLDEDDMLRIEREDMVNYAYGDAPFPPGFDNYTIIEVLNSSNVQFIEMATGAGN